MASASKYKSGAVGNMLAHYDRRTGEDKKRGNEKIDPTRTHLNYDLHTGQKADEERSGETQYQRLEKRLSEVKHRDFSKYDDNRFCDWIVTLPENVTEDKADEFFRHVYDFMCDRYGKENVISAWVHKDETTPHMHFAFVPVVKNEDGSERLCAKEVISRTELNRFHPELMKYVEEKMEQDVAILNGATAGGNLKIIELKLREALKKLAEVEARTGSLETAQPIIEDTLKMMTEVTESYRKLDEALKSKKWFGDDDKAKMKALTKELAEIKAAAETANKTAATLQKTLQGLNANVNEQMTDVFKKLDDMKAAAQKRIKRTERKLARREERVAKKEEHIELEIRQGVRKELAKLDEPIRKKKAEAAALDEEIQRKRQQLAATDTDFWSRQAYLRTAQAHQQQFTATLQEWSVENESKNVKPTFPKR